MSDFVSFCSQNSLSGMEWAGGLPGTVGGAIRGNAGAYLGETKDNVLEVESLELSTLKDKSRSKKECEFSYRMSIFKRDGDKEVILSAKFELKKGDREEIKRETQKKIDHRIDKHPMDVPNIGSTFKNVRLDLVPKEVAKEFEKSIKPDPFPVVPVAKLIIGAGLMGEMHGGAQISTKHPNFIVNTGNAKASDVLFLVTLIKEKIKEKYGVTLEEEIMVL